MVTKLARLLVIATVCLLYSLQGHTAEPAVSYSIHDESLDWGPCPEFSPRAVRLQLFIETQQNQMWIYFSKFQGSMIFQHIGIHRQNV